MALEAGLLQAIGDNKDSSITAEALSKATNTDALLIGTTSYKETTV